jgi:ABC-type branched-subunit amino acid transport system substrate-binding protein
MASFLLPTVTAPMTRIFSLILLFGVSVSQSLAQEAPVRIEEVDPIFEQAVRSYEAGDYSAARTGFEKVIGNFPANHRTTAAIVMKAKCQLSSGDALEATRTLRLFISQYPESSYRADAGYTLGLAFLSTQRYDAAADALLDSWTRLPRNHMGGKPEQDIVLGLSTVIDSGFNVVKTRNLIRETPDGKQKAFLWIKVAEKHSAMAETALAESALDSLGVYASEPLFAARIAALRGVVERRGTVKFGALLPLMKNSQSSAVRQIGEELLEGIQFAVDAYNADPGVRTRVVIDVRDTERDPLVATRLAQEMTSDPSVTAIIGPVFSNTTSAVVGLANARQVPLVTPTANSNGIAAVGPYIFQANPDYETRGIAMARFAVQNRGHKRLAVLAPIDTYSKSMADAFIREATRLGAEIVGSEWYQRGQTDFTTQLQALRKAGLLAGSPPMLSFTGALTRDEIAALVHLGVPLKTVDSLLERSAVVDAETLLGPDAKTLLDSAGVGVMLDVPWQDSLEIPVTGIDGFYVPVSMPEEIGLVASQIVYFNFKAELLGSGEWNSFQELDANKRYCSGVYFDSDSYVEPDDPGYASFVDEFYGRLKKRPTSYTLYGYDTTRLLLSLVRSGAVQRESLVRALSATSHFRGFHSTIGLSSRRVNNWIHILHFDGERIQRIDQLSIE